MINKADVKRGVMDHQLSTLNIFKKVFGNIAKPRLVSDKFVSDTVNINNFLIHKAIGV